MFTTRTLKTTKNFGDLNTWRDIPSSWSREHSVIMSIFPEFIYRFGVVLFKIPIHFSVESAMLIPKFTWIYQGPRISKTILKKNEIGVLTLHGFKT